MLYSCCGLTLPTSRFFSVKTPPWTRRSRYRLSVLCQAMAPRLCASTRMVLKDAWLPCESIMVMISWAVASLRGGDNGGYASVDINRGITYINIVIKAAIARHGQNGSRRQDAVTGRYSPPVRNSTRLRLSEEHRDRARACRLGRFRVLSRSRPCTPHPPYLYYQT